MDCVYRLGSVSVSLALEELPDPPSYSAVRALLNTLVDKGHLQTKRQGRKYIYTPTVPVQQASESALSRVVQSFFGGSPIQAAVALVSSGDLNEQDIEALEQAIAQAKGKGQ